MERWIRYLSEQELQLIREFIEVDFKINHYQKKSGESYFVAKKKLNLIRQKIATSQNKAEFKEYLDFLVYEKVIRPSIAEVIYKKHLAEIGEL
ncbi:hypothetical protein WVI01_12750 [Weissella viridescens]|uniref:hypothetical protein n=1 Tax=Weissella viridescens TaxID=1629 RepID=UPI000709C902|nr:hypothetical protein [Weissella viridescens]MBX4173465.1 hypothetical protein [Weissella viridescens]MCB6840818.1 hypothetical protein [Weissella viridescens]MCB6847551.1 hypothetical protein [Weissella viridescens]QOD86016.1 hypothetical protein IE337_07670 [Weissella viridescens]WJI91142.1 hypothetical protein PWA48_07655 [Weissella viridescens]